MLIVPMLVCALWGCTEGVTSGGDQPQTSVEAVVAAADNPARGGTPTLADLRLLGVQDVRDGLQSDYEEAIARAQSSASIDTLAQVQALVAAVNQDDADQDDHDQDGSDADQGDADQGDSDTDQGDANQDDPDQGGDTDQGDADQDDSDRGDTDQDDPDQGDANQKLVEYYYTETQCSDPWGAGGASADDKRSALEGYLRSNGVEWDSIEVKRYTDSEVFCLACVCGTGFRFYVKVSEEFSQKIAQLGFKVVEGSTACSDTNACAEATDAVVDGALHSSSSRDTFRIGKAVLAENCLTLTIGYGGGCGTVRAQLVGSPGVTKSLPPKRGIKVLFTDDDNCEAFLHREFAFDLENVQVAGHSKVGLMLEGWESEIVYRY